MADPQAQGGLRARARDAASLLLVRERSGVREVLVGRRSQRHDFLPGLYVFPGGAVDRADARARCSSELAPAAVPLLSFRAGKALLRHG